MQTQGHGEPEHVIPEVTTDDQKMKQSRWRRTAQSDAGLLIRDACIALSIFIALFAISLARSASDGDRVAVALLVPMGLAIFIAIASLVKDEDLRDSSRLPAPIIVLLSGGVIALSEMVLAGMFNLVFWSDSAGFGAQANFYDPPIFTVTMLLSVGIMSFVGIAVGMFLSLVVGVNLASRFEPQWWRHGIKALVVFILAVVMFLVLGWAGETGRAFPHHGGLGIGAVSGTLAAALVYATIFCLVVVNQQGRDRRANIREFISDVTAQLASIKGYVFAFAFILIVIEVMFACIYTIVFRVDSHAFSDTSITSGQLSGASLGQFFFFSTSTLPGPATPPSLLPHLQQRSCSRSRPPSISRGWAASSSRSSHVRLTIRAAWRPSRRRLPHRGVMTAVLRR